MCDIQDNVTKTTKAETHLTSSPMTRIEAQIKPAMIRLEPLKQLQGRGLPEPIRFSARGAREGATGGSISVACSSLSYRNLLKRVL